MPLKDKEKRREYYTKYNKEWYKKNGEKHRKNVRQWKKNVTNWLREYKSKLKCSQCGFSHPAAIDFHHTNGEKEFDISDGPRAGGIETLKKEIAKCEILCKNCHSILHWNQKSE